MGLKLYRIVVRGRASILDWHAESSREARQEAEDCGHRVKRVVFVRTVADPTVVGAAGDSLVVNLSNGYQAQRCGGGRRIIRRRKSGD